MRSLPVLALALGVLFAAQAQADWSTPEGTQRVEVNGYPLTYQVTGSGEPLVLVHGSLNDYRIWYAQVPVFAKKYRVITMSLRHYYPEKWDGTGDDFSVDRHAEDVAALIKQLGGRPSNPLDGGSGG